MNCNDIDYHDVYVREGVCSMAAAEFFFLPPSFAVFFFYIAPLSSLIHGCYLEICRSSSWTRATNDGSVLRGGVLQFV